jgi:hypothetical protein
LLARPRSIQAAWARHWAFIGPATAFMAAMSNGRPDSFSRSAMKAAGTLSAVSANTTATVTWKNSRSAHRLTAKSAPLITSGLRWRASISARITWVSQ